MSLLGRAILANLERVATSRSRDSERLPLFLARHRTVERLSTAALRSRPCRALVADVCRAAVAKYGDIDPWTALQALSSYRRFSEGTSINVIGEICERADRDIAAARLRSLFGNLLPEQKALLLTRVFYNLVLIGLERKVATIRRSGTPAAVPNVSTVLLSICSSCNLNCVACESADERDGPDATAAQIESVIAQARRLHVFHVAVVGKGEPLLDDGRKELVFHLAERHTDLNFIIFTNGTTLERRDAARLKRLSNVFMLVSVDGLEEVNDSRRGDGVFARVAQTFELMKSHGLIYGFSSTVLRHNFRHVLGDDFLAAMKGFGCKFGIYLAGIPLSRGASADTMLDPDERAEYERLYARAARGAPIVIVDPELLERTHGCRAKRGSVVYVDATTGKVSPCVKTPFAPEYCNLYSVPGPDRLHEILQSEFFVKYRESYDPCGQCSAHLPNELGRYVEEGALTESDRERAQRFLKKALRSLSAARPAE